MISNLDQGVSYKLELFYLWEVNTPLRLLSKYKTKKRFSVENWYLCESFW